MIKKERLVYFKTYKTNPENKVRAQVLRKLRYAANPEKYKAEERERNYGISAEQFIALLASQGNVCAICRTDDHSGKGWHCDHDHSTGKVRGALCFRCNIGLGNFRDDPLRLELAANYLRRHQTD